MMTLFLAAMLATPPQSTLPVKSAPASCCCPCGCAQTGNCTCGTVKAAAPPQVIVSEGKRYTYREGYGYHLEGQPTPPVQGGSCYIDQFGRKVCPVQR